MYVNLSDMCKDSHWELQIDGSYHFSTKVPVYNDNTHEIKATLYITIPRLEISGDNIIHILGDCN